jgi:hypothetical protein
VATANVKAGGSSEIEMSYTNKESGIISGKIQINDYPLTFDNDYFFSYRVNKKIKILVVNQKEENPYLKKLFGTDPLFELVMNTPKNIDYSSLGSYNLLILTNLDEISSGLADELKLHVRKGLYVVAFPGSKAAINEYNLLLSEFAASIQTLDTNALKIDKLNFRHPIYTGVFEEAKMKKENINYPIVISHYPINTSNKSNQEPLITLVNGASFLLQFSSGSGKLFFCASPLDEQYSNFPRHAIFVPTLYKIALTASIAEPLFYTIGGKQNIEFNKVSTQADPVYKIHSSDGKTEFIARTKTNGFSTMIDAGKEIKNAGLYWLKSADTDTLKSLSFNYNRLESATSCFTSKELNDNIDQLKLNNFNVIQKGSKNMTAAIVDVNKGTQLWKWCLIFALLCLGAEIAIIRWMKG